MLSKCERETHIWFTEADTEAHIYTCNKPLISKINRKFNFDLEYSAGTGDEFGPECNIPKKCICILKPRETSNELSKLKHSSNYETKETNPNMGLRGASRILGQRQIFNIELVLT